MSTIACPHCQRSFAVEVTQVGQTSVCPECGRAVLAADAELTSPYQPSPAAQPHGQRGPAGQPDRRLYDFLAPPAGSDELGQLGPYRVLRVLGAGGMGVVFLAEDPALKRRLALKAMLPALAASASARERFRREAQTVAAIEHEHIVPIYQVGEDRGIPYLAMQLLQGQSLADRIAAGGTMPLAEVVHIGRETALGLAAAHARGLVHRDIKPANLWLEAPDGRVKLLDFGLARAASAEGPELTGPGAVLGTPAFMAPEQAAGRPVDGRTDLFSLGCVLYRLCTGVLPFRGKDALATLAALASAEPRPPRALNPTLPAALSELVMRLLRKDPGQRPGTADAVAAALAAIPAGDTAVTLREIEPPAPRRRLALVLAACGLALAALMAVPVVVAMLLVGGGNGGSAGNPPELDQRPGAGQPDKKTTAGGDRPEGEKPRDKGPPPRPRDKNRYAGAIGDDREVARWLLQRRPLTLQVAILGTTELPVVKDQLPDKPFKVYGIRLDKEEDVRHELNFATGLSRLTQLHLIKCPLQDAALEDLRDLPNLKDLWLIDGEITDAGLDLLKNVPTVEILLLGGNRITGKGLDRFQGLSRLRQLGLADHPGVGDDGLEHLKACAALQTLDLSGTGVTDKGLEVLGGMPRLTHLILGKTRIGNAGLARLHTEVTVLDLSQTKVTDEGLKELTRCEELTALKLRETAIKGPGLAHLKLLPKLHELDLHGTAVTAESLAVLKELKGLQILNLSETSIDDTALPHLKALPPLYVLSISGTKLTPAAIAELKKALPKTAVYD